MGPAGSTGITCVPHKYFCAGEYLVLCSLSGKDAMLNKHCPDLSTSQFDYHCFETGCSSPGACCRVP